MKYPLYAHVFEQLGPSTVVLLEKVVKEMKPSRRKYVIGGWGLMFYNPAPLPVLSLLWTDDVMWWSSLMFLLLGLLQHDKLQPKINPFSLKLFLSEDIISATKRNQDINQCQEGGCCSAKPDHVVHGLWNRFM